MTKALLDGNIYNKLAADEPMRDRIADLISCGRLEILATPVVVDELSESPFGGLPDWFPIHVEVEAVCVLGYARLGMARLSDGVVYEQHKGSSTKFPDAIIAESANALADILVSDDRRCRKRLADVSQRCRPMSYEEFCAWVADESASEVACGRTRG